MKMKYFGLSESTLFHFHGIFKSWGREGGSNEPPEPVTAFVFVCVYVLREEAY